MMDLSKLSTEDLMALKSGDLSKVSTEGLQHLRGQSEPIAPQSFTDRAIDYLKKDIAGTPRRLGDAVAGAVRGAGSIGATLLSGARGVGQGILDATPADMRPQVTARAKDLPRGPEMRAGMDGGLRELGADPSSGQFRLGKVAGEVAGTAGVGGAIANGARFLGASPELAGAIASGGFSGGGNLLTRAVGGAINGAATAGLIDPADAGKGALVGGALPVGVKVAGAAGNALSSVAEAGSKRLMQSAIKPTIAQRSSGDADVAIDTLLQYGISPTKEGVNKLRDLIDAKNTEIGSKIVGSTATIDKQKVMDRLDDVRGIFGNQVSPTKDMAAIQGVADDFATHPQMPLPQIAIPVQQAQKLKQGTYRVLQGKFGEEGSAATEAQKGLARGLKEEIAQAVPGIQGLNAEESRLIKTLDVAERRALLEMNKNPVGLTALAHNPIAAAGFLADRSAAFKALAARMIHASTNPAGVAGQKLLGAASNPLLRTTGLVAAESNP